MLVAGVGREFWYLPLRTALRSRLPYGEVRDLMKDEPGFWTDDLHKKWETPEPDTDRVVHTLALVFEYCGAAPKSYGISYIVPTLRERMDEDAASAVAVSATSAVDHAETAPRLVCAYDLEDLREKFKFKGIPKGVSVSIHGETCGEMNLALLKRLMSDGLAAVDAEEESLPDAEERPQVELESIGKVGYKLSRKDYLGGLAPFSLKPIEIKRTLFKTRFNGRKIAERRSVLGSPLCNDVLAPLSMPLDDSEGLLSMVPSELLG